MALKKYLGKISSVQFGLGGYQEAMLGLHLCFDFNGSYTCTTKSYWDSNMIDCTEHSKWKESDRFNKYAGIMYYISDLLNDAKVRHISELKNKPVEVTLDGNTFHSFKILTEVL